MYECPRCHKATFSLRQVAFSSSAVCSNCHAVVKHQRGWRNVVVLLPLAVFSLFMPSEIVPGLIGILVAGAVCFFILVKVVKLELK